MTQQLHSWVYTQKNKNTNLKGYMHPNVQSSIILQLPKYGSNLNVHQQSEWIKKKWYTHTDIQNGILLSHKKNKILSFVATQMDL